MSEGQEVKDKVPGILALMTTVMVALATLTPYVIKLPETNLNLIVQAQTTLWNGWLLILGFYFGTTIQSNKQNDAISNQAQALGQATARIPRTPQGHISGTDKVAIAPGEEVTVQAEDVP